MAYFGAGCLGTGIGVSMLRNVQLGFGGTIGMVLGSFAFLFGTILTDYEKSFALKNMMFGGYVGCTALSLVPLLQAYGGAVMFDALLCTGATMGSLGGVAWNAPSE